MTKKFFAIALLTVALVSGFFAGRAYARQDHMWNAMNALKNARTELNAAETNKGGHREAALKLVNDAIDEVQLGIDYARTH
jgi:hypothetical protein